jgi:hypothetical protein
MFGGLFFEFSIPFTLEGHNFLNFILFLMTSNTQDTPIRGFKFCLDTGNNGALPLNLACLECLSVQSLVDLP